MALSTLCVIGAVSAFAALFLSSRMLFAAMRRDVARGVAGTGGDGFASGIVAVALRNGVALLEKPACVLARNRSTRGIFEAISQWLGSRGVVCPAESAASLAIAIALVVGLLGAIATANPIGGIVVDALVVAVVAVRLQAWRESQRDELRDSVPLALSVMGDCFQSGYSLLQTMEQVSEQTQGALSAAFGRCADSLRLGGTSHEALSHIKGVDGVEEMAFVAVALDVQHQSGGSFASVLGNAQRMVADEAELRRSLRVQTAQARLSAQVVCIMPFLLMAVLSLMSEGFLSAFFESAAGFALLAVALLMEGAGIAMVRKMLKVAE